MILGFNCWMQDAAACVLGSNGEVRGAVEEERLTRRKHTGELPRQAIQWCLEQSHGPIEHVAFNMRPWEGLARRAAELVRGLPGSAAMARSRGPAWGRMIAAPRTVQPLIPGRWRFHFVRHHLAHAASAFYPSPFDRAAILVADGSGEIASTTWYRAAGRRMEPLGSTPFPHSLGYFYSALTQWLGFTPAVDEGKAMGLSAYGAPDPGLMTHFRAMIDDHGRIDRRWFDFPLGGPRYFSERWLTAFGPARVPESDFTDQHYAVAASGQRRLEEVLFAHLHRLAAEVPVRDLCLAGGVALNSVANGKIPVETPFERVFVQPAPHDAGTAWGAALYVRCASLGLPRPGAVQSVATGPCFDAAAIDAAIRRAGLTSRRVDPAAEGARLLAEGRVIGWFQGRAELGPRALGHRSILADPRPADMTDRVNAQVKRRETFRPFAPAVLDERAGEWFQGDPTPFMTAVCPVRSERRSEVPAITHVDGTARVQTVCRAASPAFYGLIEAFEGLTGVPMVLNTSFNVRGEPIVNTPDEALVDLLSTGLDALLLEDRLVEKPAG